MMRRTGRFLVIILTCLHGFTLQGSTPLAAEEYLLAPDPVSQRYRTGEADPSVSRVPKDIQQMLDLNPRAGIGMLVDYFLEECENEYRLIKCFHDWITGKILYDPEADFISAWQEGRQRIPPYSVILRQRRAGHAGFARLFSAMCDLSGVEAVTICGISNRYLDQDMKPAGHTWNGVKIGGSWYIVDTVNDVRSRRLPGGEIDTDLYTDRELFIKPEEKILINFPEDDRYQFLEERVSKEDFLSGPLLGLGCARYGVVYTGLRQQAENGGSGVTVTSVPYQRYNRAEFAGGSASFLFSAPEDVRFQVWLTDEEGNRYPRYGFAYREENRHVCTFSLPEPGEYTAEVYGLELGEVTGWTHLFSCAVSGPERGPTLPVPGLFFKTYGWERSGLEAVSSRIGISTGGRYVSLTLKVPEEIDVEAEVETETGDSLKQRVSRSYPEKGQVKFTIVPDERGKFYTTLRVKEKGPSGRRFSALEFAFVNILSGGVRDFPHHEIFFQSPFLEEGFRFISDNVMHAADDGYYRVTVAAPEGLRMDGGMETGGSGETGDRQTGSPNSRFTYEKEGSVYSFFFLPKIDESERGEIYMLGPSGERRLLAEIILPRFSSFRPTVHEPGWIYKKNGFSGLGITLLEENIHRAGKPGFAYLGLDIPAGVDVFARYVLLRRRDVSRSHVAASTPSREEKRFYFRLPEEGPGVVTLFARKKSDGGEASREISERAVEILEFALYPGGAVQEIPPSGEVIYYPEFYRKGFVHVRDNFGSPDAERFEITIDVPDPYSLTCRVVNEEGKTLTDRCSYRIRGDETTFFIDNPPEGERWRADISAVDLGGVVTEVCRFFLAGRAAEDMGTEPREPEGTE